MYFIMSHPEALQKIRQEIHDVLDLDGVEFNIDRDVALSREQLDKLVYLGTSGFLCVVLVLGEFFTPLLSVHRELHQREPPPGLGLHQHPSGCGGLQSASGG